LRNDTAKGADTVANERSSDEMVPETTTALVAPRRDTENQIDTVIDELFCVNDDVLRKAFEQEWSENQCYSETERRSLSRPESPFSPPDTQNVDSSLLNNSKIDSVPLVNKQDGQTAAVKEKERDENIDCSNEKQQLDSVSPREPPLSTRDSSDDSTIDSTSLLSKQDGKAAPETAKGADTVANESSSDEMVPETTTALVAPRRDAVKERNHQMSSLSYILSTCHGTDGTEFALVGYVKRGRPTYRWMGIKKSIKKQKRMRCRQCGHYVTDSEWAQFHREPNFKVGRARARSCAVVSSQRREGFPVPAGKRMPPVKNDDSNVHNVAS
jgi:Pyruvate/2-oxoacid:ferredoxin oxidoreductase delta subunit